MIAALARRPRRDDAPGRVAPTIAAMVGLEWRRLRRDPVGLVFTLAMPVAVAVVLGTIYMSESGGPAVVGVVAEASDSVAADLVARLGDNPTLDVRPYPDRAALDRAVRRRVVEAGVVVPASAEDGLLTGGEVELVGPPGVAAPSGVRAAVEASAAETTAAVQLGAALAPEGPLDAGLAAARRQLAEGAVADASDTSDPGATGGSDDAGDDGARDRRRDAAGEAVMATLVLFVFMNTAAGAASWPEARELGVVGRLRSTAASPPAVTLGFALGLASFAVVQAAIVIGVGAVLFDLPLRSPAAVVVVVAAAALAAGGMAVLLATVLPNSAAGVSIAGPLAFVLAMLGGCLWPLEIAPAWLASTGRATPQLWAVEALKDGAIAGEGMTGVVGGVAVLAAIGLMAGSVGARRIARAVGTA